MKRKLGHKNKKKKSKKIHVESSKIGEELVVSDEVMVSTIDYHDGVSSGSEDDNSCSEDDNDDKCGRNNGDGDGKVDVKDRVAVAEVVVEKAEVVPLPPPRPAERMVNVRPDGLIERPPPKAVYGRVKLKLKAKPPVAQQQPQPVVQSQLQLEVGGGEKSRQDVIGENKEGGGGGGNGEKMLEKSDDKVKEKSDDKVMEKSGDKVMEKSGGGGGNGEKMLEKIDDKVKEKSDDKVMEKSGDKVMEKSGCGGGNGEKMLEKIDDKVKEKSDDKVMDKSGDKVVEKSDDKVKEKSDDKVMEKSGDKVMEKSGDKVMEKSGDKVVEKSGDEAMKKSDDQVAEKSGDKVMEKSSDKVVEKSDKVAKKSGHKGVEKSGGKVAEKGGVKVTEETGEKVTEGSGGKVERSGEKLMENSDDKAVEKSGDKLVDKTGDSGSAESKKSGGVGIKIVSSKKSSLSLSPGGNGKEGGSGIKELPMSLSHLSRNEKEGGGIRESPMKSSLSPSGATGKELGEIMVSPKSLTSAGENGKMKISSLSPSSGNAKMKSSSSTPSSGNGKTKSSSSSPPSGNGKESGGSRVLPEDEEQNEEEEHEDEVREEKPKVLNKQQLKASLEVISKVMKMDAAEPFNVPVNPIELEIPDYFDVIDTPMDFGTIRNNLEQGAKYMDSEDVYKDVEYIWNNCFKYNNKGDYIVDLMKRVKKNFMKYWMGAGLNSEQTQNIVGGEITSTHGKKAKKGKGFKLHKDDCMCAICIMRRRRREREAREALEAGHLPVSPRIKAHQTSMLDEYKQEVYSHVESPYDDTSRQFETSPDGDADTEMEDGEMRLEDIDEQNAGDVRTEFRDKSDRSGDVSDKSLWSDKGDTELYSHIETEFLHDSGTGMMIDGQKQLSVQPGGQSSGYLQHRNELMEFEKKRQRLRLLETFRDLENPMLSGLCGTLFPVSASSVWNGANSLFRCQKSIRCRSNIHEAVASLTDKSTSRK